MVAHVYSNCLDLVSDNLQWFFENGYVEESCKAITNKLNELEIIFDDTQPELRQRVAFFLSTVIAWKHPELLAGPGLVVKELIDGIAMFNKHFTIVGNRSMD